MPQFRSYRIDVLVITLSALVAVVLGLVPMIGVIVIAATWLMPTRPLLRGALWGVSILLLIWSGHLLWNVFATIRQFELVAGLLQLPATALGAVISALAYLLIGSVSARFGVAVRRYLISSSPANSAN
ncbi:MAG: hypothetical protein EB075_09970 [Bacteroidetes bacterium]|nr:hypothetical protein [Bacteroidota bacterium]